MNIEKYTTPHAQNSEKREVWRHSGDLFDEGEVVPDHSKIERGLASAGLGGYSPELAPGQHEGPKNADELIARTTGEMRQFGRTDERIAYQVGRPRAASPSRPEQVGRRAPRSTRDDDDSFFEDPLGRGRNGIIG